MAIASQSTFSWDGVTELTSDRETEQAWDVWTKGCHAIALGLFWHQDIKALAKILTSYVATPEHLILAYAIALCCRDALNPRSLTSQICAFLSQELEELVEGANPDNLTSLIQQFRLVQDLVDRGESGGMARQALSQPIAYGLYCFLSTPNHWGLATKRTQEINPIIGASVGAIAGAYQGQVFVEFPDRAGLEMLELGDQLGDRLLAAWAGVYDLSPTDDLAGFNPAIAAPDIL
jgi:hypothetical protein